MEITSAKDLTTDSCVSLTVYVLRDTQTEDFMYTFELVIPEEAVDVSQYYSLVDGIDYAKFKMDKLLEAIEEDAEDDE